MEDGEDSSEPITLPEHVVTKEGEKLTIYEAQRRAALILDDIGKKFNKNRKVSRSKAFEQYQHDLMENLSILHISGVMDMDKVFITVRKCEEYMRTASAGKSPVEAIGSWLSGKADSGIEVNEA